MRSSTRVLRRAINELMNVAVRLGMTFNELPKPLDLRHLSDRDALAVLNELEQWAQRRQGAE